MVSSTKSLIEYFKKNLSKGYTPETLKWALINQGYSKSIVQASLKEAQKELAKEAPILREKPEIKYEVFDEKGNPIVIPLKKSWWKRLFKL